MPAVTVSSSPVTTTLSAGRVGRQGAGSSRDGRTASSAFAPQSPPPKDISNTSRQNASNSAALAAAAYSGYIASSGTTLANTASANASAPTLTLRYRTDLDKQVIHFMLQRLTGCRVEEVGLPSTTANNDGAREVAGNVMTTTPPAAATAAAGGDRSSSDTACGEWHFFWMSVSRIRSIFSAAEFRLQDHQIINHFPNHNELTRKDLMYKNIKRYVRERQSRPQKLVLVCAADWRVAALHASGAHIHLLSSGATTEEATATYAAAAAASASVNTPRMGGSGGSNILRATVAEGLHCTTAGFAHAFDLVESVPITYNIPNDLSMFVEEFKKRPGSTWIVKPTSRSQGKGIFLVNRVQQLLRWAKEKKEAETMAAAAVAASSGSHHATVGGSSAAAVNAALDRADSGVPLTTASGKDALSMLGTFIVSRYIANPLLIGGKKFDMRLYVLVTSYKPLVAYFHKDGFARFCATKYVSDSLAEDDLGSHLTNVALQKTDENYNAVHGGKWTVANLFLYVQGRYGAYMSETLMQNIEFLIYHSLKAMEQVMFNDKHSFELYGYDVLIDDTLKPHLIEVNASPSLSTTTPSDRLLKEAVLNDTLKIVLPPGYPSPSAMPYWEYRTRTDLTMQLKTGFKLLQFDE